MKQSRKDPYSIIKHLHVTEKTRVLQELKNSEGNRSVSRCETPKYVFLVDKKATKPEIAGAVEEIYNERNVKVVRVNTLNTKGKKRRVRGKLGKTASFKKAIVTLEKGDNLEDI